MRVYIKGMEMPKSCYECWALDDDYDYPMCRITQEQRGYNFDTRGRKMAKCPLINVLEPPIEIEKKKAKLKENGDWDCPNVDCDECDHHRSVEWCSLAIPNHEEIDDTYKMVNEAFFEGFDAAEKQYRLLIETIEELDKKIADAEWIPCSERLPEDSGDYLVCPSDGVIEDYSDCSDVMIMPYDADCEAFGWWTERYDPISLGFVDSDFDEFEVIAWMPLPKPYREDDEV